MRNARGWMVRDSRSPSMPKNSRTCKTGRNSLQIAESVRTAPAARNRAIELHLRPRNSLSYLRFAVRSIGQRKPNRKLAERVGFEPSRDERERVARCLETTRTAATERA